MSYKSITRAICAAVPCMSVLAFAGGAHASLIIDDFKATEDGSLWQTTLETQNAELDLLELMPSLTEKVIGGSRRTVITAEQIGIADFDFVRGTLAPSAGIFDYASTANARGTLSFYYDGADPDFKTDFSGKSGISIDFISFDFANDAPLPVTITLSDSVGSAAHTMSLGENELNLFFAMSNFNGIDLTDIRNIQIDFDPGIGMDFRLSQFSAVPAPGALMLLAMGGMIGRRRRRSDRSAATTR